MQEVLWVSSLGSWGTLIYLHPYCDAVFLPFGKKDLLDISGSFCKLAADFDDCTKLHEVG